MTSELRAGYNVRKYPTLRRFLNDTEHEVQAIMGPFGSGKSSASIVKLVEHGATIPAMRDGMIRARYLVARNTYRELQDTTIKTFFKWFPPIHCGNYNESKNTYMMRGMGERGPFDIEILFRALDRPDHVGHLLSLELTGAWLNEVREFPWSLIGPLFGRLGRFPPRDEVPTYLKLLMMDTNPPDNDSEFYKFFEIKKPQNAVLYKQPGGRSKDAENLDNLEAGYYDSLANILSEDEVKVYVDGEYGFIRTGKAVYPAYRDSLHCREFDFDPRLPIYRGWDFGLTPACVFAQFPPGGQLRYGYELCATRAGADAFSGVVLKFCRTTFSRDQQYIDVGDPAGEAASQTDEVSCFDILQGKGIDIRGGEQTLEIRIGSVDLALRSLTDHGEPQLLVHPRCSTLRKGFQGGYQYRRLITVDSAGELRYSDKPDKNRYSHPHDATQYVAAEIFAPLLRDRESQLRSERQQATADSDFDPFNV